MTHIAEYKKKLVEEFTDLINKYSIVAVVNMENMPTPQLQNMRQLVRDNVVLRMSKKRLMKIAFDRAKETKKGIDGLKKYLTGMPALMFTNENPFKLYKILSENKSEAPAKAGQTSPKDIVVQAGPTPFAPGPIIGELGAAGIKAGIDAGKVIIKEDSLVVKKGEQITQKQAEILTRLDIKPMEIGLDLIAAYENGTIFEKNILAVDETEYINKLSLAGTWAINLAVGIGYTTKDTVELLINKAFMDAKALGLSENIMADAIIEELIAKAEREMLSVKEAGNIEILEKPVEEKLKEVPVKVAPKQEEKPAEKPEQEKPVEEAKKVVPKVEEKQPEQVKLEKEELVETKPSEKTAKPPVKEEKPYEEPKKEVPPQEKQEEKPAPKTKPEMPSKEIKDTELKVDEIVKKIKDHATGADKEISAEKLVRDVLITAPKKPVKEEPKPKGKIPSKPKKIIEDIDTTKVDNIVKKIKNHEKSKDKEVSAEQLVEEVKKEEPKLKEEEKVPTLQELTERKKKQSKS